MFGGWILIFVTFYLVCYDDGFCPRVVECGVGPTVLPEGLNHVGDGGRDCADRQS